MTKLDCLASSREFTKLNDRSNQRGKGMSFASWKMEPEIIPSLRLASFRTNSLSTGCNNDSFKGTLDRNARADNKQETLKKRCRSRLCKTIFELHIKMLFALFINKFIAIFRYETIGGYTSYEPLGS
eukprot:m.116903 g.116903  ORF g.116903 m.116903 type:complete len:127 (-) comp23064_c0_seq6:1560-1940(-)